MADFDWGKYFKRQDLGQAGGDLAGMLATFLGGRNYKNPMEGTEQYFNQIPGVLEKAFSPYEQAGSQALPKLESEYGNLISDPTGEMNKIGAGYKMSPGYQFQLKQALQGATNQAAAGGMAGSPEAQQRGADMAEQMANRDYYNYVDRGLGEYHQGLGGEQNLAGMGERAASEKGEDLVNALLSRIMMQYAGQQNQNEHKRGVWGTIAGIAKDAAPFIAGAFL